ncbi:MAG TPA: hypothetical protein VMZ02_00715 [Candidatus Limnocylindrales bacterium]|nr:hypothetical protein [Candidatus Limnocylindrales bacterium]
MDFQIKLFNRQDEGNHLVFLTRGSMDAAAFRQLFAEIEKAALGLQECKVLVDLSDSTYQIDPTEIEELAAATQLTRWPRTNLVAIVSTPKIADYRRLYFLRTELAARGLAVKIFRYSRIAIDWLAVPG